MDLLPSDINLPLEFSRVREFYLARSQPRQPRKNIENIVANIEKTAYNDFVDVFPPPTSQRNLFDNDEDNPIELMNEESVSAEKILRLLLTKILKKLQAVNKLAITETEVNKLREQPSIRKLFRKTSFLTNIDLDKFQSIEETTCFLINLTNLLWIHVLMFSDEDLRRGLFSKNWPVRQIFNDSIGYNIGKLGFVSLHDLHSALFSFPSVYRKKKLGSLNFCTDPRIHFLVSQPYLLSPRLQVLSPNSFQATLATIYTEYIERYVFIRDFHLHLPVPFLLFLEREGYDENETDASPSDKIPAKLTILIDILKSRNFPYEKLLTRDVYLVNDTMFRIKFKYSMFEIPETENCNKTVWRSCRIHRSLYQCIMQHVNIIRSTMLEDHYSEVKCQCEEKTSEQICYNNTLMKMGKLFEPLFDKFTRLLDHSNKGLRCFYASLAFTVGATSTSEFEDSLSNYKEALQIYRIARSVFINYPTDMICEKMKMCLRVIIVENDLYPKWPYWYDLFFGNPNDVLTEIVVRENAALACEWVSVQLQYETDFHFSPDARSKFLTLLSGLEDTTYLRKAFEYTRDIPFADIIDCLIESHCPVSKLISLTTTIIDINNLTDSEVIKFHALLIGLKILNMIAKNEQIIYNPALIVEQLIINKKVDTVKEALTEVIPLMHSLPEKLKQEESLSRSGIDEILMFYADRALSLQSNTAPTRCKFAAMLHAMLFRDVDNFRPPDKIPAEEDWIPRGWATGCLCCQKEFGVFTRRYNCRRCGRVICGSCSSKKLNLITYSSQQRVCDQCFKYENQYQTTMGESCNKIRKSSIIHSSCDETHDSLYILTFDRTYNECVRSQVLFNPTPDVELCLSLLQLHTKDVSVPSFLYSHAEELLKLLRQRLVCPTNIDYPELAHIIKSLLQAAKVYYSHLEEFEGMSKCEESISQTNMLNQLANFKFSPPEPGKPITELQDWKQIRKLLLEQHNWELALEISVKNGLECNSIWYLWGMHLLKTGEWSFAREKFLRSNLKKSPRLLNSVLEILVSDTEKEPPKLFAKLFHNNTKKSVIQDKISDERLYYLKTYGSGIQLFDFYVQNERIMDAVHTAYDRKISTNNFVQKVYVPYLKKNEQTKILKYMESVDMKLIGWKDYIEEICVFCDSNEYLEALYETQLWIKDYYRAAITSTMLYRKNAKTYLELSKNEEYLKTAIAHFDSVIARVVQKQNTILELVIPSAAIEKYKFTVSLQWEVTNFICENLVCANRKLDIVPTFFGKINERQDIIKLVADASEDVDAILKLIIKIVNAFDISLSETLDKIVTAWVGENKEHCVQELVKCSNKSVLNPNEIVDCIAVAALRAKTPTPTFFMDNIKNEDTKFNIYLEMGYLKECYLLAVKWKRDELLEKIYHDAVRRNKSAIQSICTKKLGYQPKLETE